MPFPFFILQFAMWVDAVIFVFSLEDEISFQTVYHYYSRMANYRNTSEIPMVLVGTQGKCSLDLHDHIDFSRVAKPHPVLTHSHVSTATHLMQLLVNCLDLLIWLARAQWHCEHWVEMGDKCPCSSPGRVECRLQ